MKVELENISITNDHTSFRWLINPKLNDFYYWHFHPEFELIYIETEEIGTRHVGEHISKYKNSDLVFIGSNIPHLNFDFGLKKEYYKTVLHIQPHFLQSAMLQTPELKELETLFEKVKLGISFGEAIKNEIGNSFKNIHKLTDFEQFLSILKLLNYLAKTNDYQLLHKEIPKNEINKKERIRLKNIYKFIDLNFQRKIEIKEIAFLANLSEAAFCRYFKKMTKLTFTEFLNHYRINEAKRLLILDKNITETCFECGFESLSYFNRSFKKLTGENPSAFKKRL